ncbi:leucine-rich repeat domain-containing protein [Listeria ilorinensis]|uniref:leucine-rich repeat domain-containing protein n=1 Tax=Listeria ilorinensis TaxID=2867439 RepID=UPI001EF6F949|nr:leucine-rich repeat domain-containing protein [Listeria ilorinensis]
MKLSRLAFPTILIVALLNPLTIHAEEKEEEQSRSTETQLQEKKGQEVERKLQGTTQTFNNLFPDDNLAMIVANILRKQPTDTATSAELSQIKSLYCYYEDIHSMEGIEYLTELETLYCGDNQLTELDISQNSKLTTLDCTNNQLEKLDISKNPNLVFLNCWYNQLTELDASKNPNLKTLDCRYNQLMNLDIGDNPRLTYLYCSNNQLTELDVSSVSNLDSLYCEYNQLTKLNVSQNSILSTLSCSNNQLSELNVRENPRLFSLDCFSNQLTELNLNENPNLAHLYCADNQLTEIDISQNPDLRYFHFCNNRIQDFSFMSLNSSIEGYDATGQQITMMEQESQEGFLQIPVSQNLKDEHGNRMNISVTDGGVYNATTNTITWTNLSKSGSVEYAFLSDSGVCSGTVTIPYQEQTSQAVTLTTDKEITYDVSDIISEQQFLQDILATTEEGNELSSNFESVVDFSIPGTYEVTVTASNETDSVEQLVNVHIVNDDQDNKPSNNTPNGDLNVPDSSQQADSDLDIITPKEAGIDVNQDSPETKAQSMTVLEKKSNAQSALPETGDRSEIGWVILGSMAILSGFLIFKRKK